MHANKYFILNPLQEESHATNNTGGDHADEAENARVDRSECSRGRGGGSGTGGSSSGSSSSGSGSR